MRKRLLFLALVWISLTLSGCRFAVVESDSVRIEAPTPSQAPSAEAE